MTHLRSRPAVVGWTAALVALTTSCWSRHYSLQYSDRLARTSEARTIVLDEKLSLYSPDEPFEAQQFMALLRKQRSEVFELFDVDNEEPIVVQLHPNEGIAMDVEAQGDQL